MRYAPVLLALFLVGCAANGGATITEAPSNWSEFEGQTVTLEGLAGNSKTGSLIRLGQGRYIELENMPRVFGPDEVARSIGVRGSVVPGTGLRQGRYVVKVDKWWLLKTTNLPQKSKSDQKAK